MRSQSITILVLIIGMSFTTPNILQNSFSQITPENTNNGINDFSQSFNGDSTVIDPSIIEATPNDVDNTNDETLLKIISGNWSLSGDELNGGTTNNTVNNIIIRPNLTLESSPLTTSVKVNEISNNTPNYASIVHSFSDIHNYKQTSINIVEDLVFVVFSEITNDTLYHYPTWPGIYTGLTWTPDSVFKMTLSTNGQSQTFILNGTAYTDNGNITIDNGDLGLSYDRTPSVDFHNFESTTSFSNSFIVSDSQTQFLEDENLPEGSYIHLYDTSPYHIISGHIAAQLPCDDASNTDVDILTGQAPNLLPTVMDSVTELSNPGELCLYHKDITYNMTNPVTDIAIQNNSDEDIEFPATSSVVTSVNEIGRLSNN